MKKMVLFILIPLVIIVFFSMIFQKEKGPKKLIYRFTFGKQGAKLGEFNFERLVSIAIKDNYLFVADSGNNRIQVLKINPDGSLIAKAVFGKEGKGLGEFITPSTLVTRNNYLFVSDSGNNRIQVLKINPDGSLIAEAVFGKEGKGLGEFNFERLVSIAIKDNYLFVADSGNNRIQVLKINPDGSLIAKSVFGKEGKGLGEFEGFFGLSLIVKDNYLFVSDPGNNRIQVLKINPDATVTPQHILNLPKTDFSFIRFFSMGLDRKRNRLYVVDPDQNCIRVLKINPNGSLASHSVFGREGSELGKFNAPLGLAIKGNYLYVVDSGNQRIQVLEIK